MIWIAAILFWAAGAVATAYLLGRFTSPDRYDATSEIRALSPFLIPLWPIAALIFGIALPVIKSATIITNAGMLAFKVGDNHRIEWESKMKMLAPHVPDHEEISKMESEIDRMSREAAEHWDGKFDG